MEKAKVKDIEIAYEVTGSGDPLILIGGFTMVKESWTDQVARLSKHFQVVAFDNRGVGETTVPSEPFTIADMAEDTVGLMDAIGIESAHFFGVSMGGLIAQMLALDHAARVKKIALGCTTHGGRHAVQPQKEVMALLGSAADPNLSPEEAMRMRLPIMFTDRFLREQEERVEEFVQTGLRYLPTLEGATGQMKALSVFNVKRRLGEIKCPVLAIAGSEDKMMPPENSKLLTEGIQGAKLYVVQEAGHSFFHEKPAEVCRVLVDFFEE
jgi:pimeloyl-ACP methyl ester carboxylesterase